MNPCFQSYEPISTTLVPSAVLPTFSYRRGPVDGQSMGIFIDITGTTFGKLTVIRRHGHYRSGSKSHILWLTVCDCGTVKAVRGDHLRMGFVRSCGDHQAHPPVPGQRGTATSYNAAHKLIRRIKGSASARLCVLCGEPAQAWAYLRGSATEQRTEGGIPYSDNPADYWPLCAHDHALIDIVPTTTRVARGASA